MRRHLLSLRELETDQVLHLLALAERCARAGSSSAALRGRTAVTLFYEPSTRTEISFELAGKRLGADVVRCDVERSSVKKGETLVDTAQTLEALGADVIAIRHPSAGAPQLASRWVRSAIVNAGDGMHEHPTQGLVDLLTVRQRKGRIAGLKVAIVGDILHSRVARSAMWGFTKLGATVTLVGPATLLPPVLKEEGRSKKEEGETSSPLPSHVTVTSSLEEGLEGADVVMALRMQLERQHHGYVPSLAEYTRLYAITPHTLARARPDALVMHPGPMNLGVELVADVAYGAQSVIQSQVANGVLVRMGVLLWVLGLDEQEERKHGSAEIRKRETVPVIASASEAIPGSVIASPKGEAIPSGEEIATALRASR